MFASTEMNHISCSKNLHGMQRPEEEEPGCGWHGLETAGPGVQHGIQHSLAY